MKTITQIASIAALAGLTALAPAYATDSVEKAKDAAVQYVDDAALTAHIKAKFAEDKAVSAMRVNVETKDGVVQLSGFVNSLIEKNRAEMLAKDVNGVKRIHNDIIVGE